MTNDHKTLENLRRLAEKRLNARHKDPLKLRPDQLPALVHELEVHQIELEMQNEDLRRAQELLEQARDRYVNLYDYAPVGYLTIGSKGRIEEANLTACNLFDTERAALKGQRLSRFVVAEYQDALYLHRRRLLAGKGPQTCELVMWGSGNVRFHAQVKMVLLDGRTGAIGAYRIVITDVSERKRTEEERDRLRRELQQARKWEALGQLAGGIAHDFNNLLSVILASTELLRDQADRLDQASMAWYLEQIQRAGDRATALVSQVLAFSRGKSERCRPQQLPVIIGEEMEMLRSLLTTGIDIKTEIEDRLPDVLIDPDELSQVLMNLSINARDAMGGRGVLTIGLGRASESGAECTICHEQVRGDWVELSIGDTGCGMEAEILERIFEPFFSTKSMVNGTGMGLPVVLGILRRGGGHVLVESEPGKGTIFRLLFPSAPGAAAASGTADAHPDALPGGRGQHLLVLDDEPGLARLLGDLLELHGYRVTAMSTGRQALDLFRENPQEFALVLTDQTMPGLSGLELIKALRTIRPGIPVILNTGFSTYVDAEIAASMGIGYLEKPVTAMSLTQAVDRLLTPAPNAVE